MKPNDGPENPAADPSPTPTIAGPSTGYEATIGVEPGVISPASRSSLPGYQLAGVIGRGGMGEVVLGRDERIGRDVAIKRTRGTAPTADAVTRFFREARIQARLEHSAIVPVHELGRDVDGQPFFTMKRLAGVTLAELTAATPPPSQQRLLRAFTDVCNAVEFAHSHGVVHRDVKPANIMLGEFGEVYVLDWGLARVAGEAETGSVAADIASLDGMTTVGAVLGTPGCMAPEQVRGAADVGPPGRHIRARIDAVRDPCRRVAASAVRPRCSRHWPASTAAPRSGDRIARFRPSSTSRARPRSPSIR